MKHLKRLLLITIIILFSHTTFAPAMNRVIIVNIPAIQPFEALWKAICIVESGENPFAYNMDEEAVGIAQIRQCRVDHFNQLTGKSYSLVDCFDSTISREIFMLFVTPDLELTAKSWNGSGPMTEMYWERVNQLLQFDL
jgi:hypothetical protein